MQFHSRFCSRNHPRLISIRTRFLNKCTPGVRQFYILVIALEKPEAEQPLKLNNLLASNFDLDLFREKAEAAGPNDTRITNCSLWGNVSCRQ